MSAPNTEEKKEEIPAWVAVQKKTFTKWTNTHLKKVGASLEDVTTDFDTGIRLMQLVKALYGIDMPKYNANPKMRPHKLDNLSLAFNMVEKAQIKTNFLKTTHLLDHDLKMILGMIWAIILDYQIKGISVEDLSAKEALLLWCQKKTKGYNNVKVNDFSASWNTGLALAALIHHHRPDLIDFDSLNKDNVRENIELVFKVAEDHLGIDRLLDVDDLAMERPDDKSVMTYISEFYHKFTSENKKEIAARRIQKFAQYNQNVEELENNYINNAQQLLEWVNQQIERLGQRDFPEGFEEIQTHIKEHRNWKTSEKAQWTDKKQDNEAANTNIQARLRAGKRKQWAAPEGHSVEDVDQAWERLAEAEKNRGKALRDHLNKNKDGLRKGFADAANEFYDYVTGVKKNVADSGNHGDLQEQLAFLKQTETDMDSDHRSAKVEELGRTLEDLGLADENPYTDFTLEELLLLLESVKTGLKKKRQAIQNQLSAGKTSGISDEQLEEFKDAFRHFDKDKSGALDKLEFKAVLQTLGQTYNDDAFNQLFLKLANGGERIQMDAFVDYMVSLFEDTDDANQIKASFKVLANDKNDVSKSDLRCPPLVDNEIDYLTTRMSGEESAYDYNAYTDSVFA